MSPEAITRTARYKLAANYFRMYEELGSLAAVGLVVGLSGQSVANVMRFGGYRAHKSGQHPKGRRGTPRRRPGRWETVTRLTAEGWKRPSIAAFAGCTVQTVSLIRKAAGCRVGRGGGQKARIDFPACVG